jgi:hypothetical protein
MDSSFHAQQNPSNIASVWMKFNNVLRAINQNLKTHPISYQIETIQLANHFNITEIEELFNYSNDRTIIDCLKTTEVRL